MKWHVTKKAISCCQHCHALLTTSSILEPPVCTCILSIVTVMLLAHVEYRGQSLISIIAAERQLSHTRTEYGKQSSLYKIYNLNHYKNSSAYKLFISLLSYSAIAVVCMHAMLPCN